MKPTLENVLLTWLSLAHPNPVPHKQLKAVGITHGWPEAEVLGMMGDLIAKDKIQSRPDGVHGAVFVLLEAE